MLRNSYLYLIFIILLVNNIRGQNWSWENRTNLINRNYRVSQQYRDWAFDAEDIDSDGDIDMVGFSHNLNIFTEEHNIIENYGGISLDNVRSDIVINPDQTINNVQDLVLVDLDGDGFKDIVTSSNDVIGAVYRIYGTPGNWSLSRFTTFPDYNNVPDRNIAVGDITGNGSLDLLLGSWRGNIRTLFNCNGTWGTWQNNYFPGNTKMALRPIIANFDNDSEPEIVLFGYDNGQQMNFMLDKQNSQWVLVTNNGILNASRFCPMVAVDIDNDGDLDIVQIGKDLNNQPLLKWESYTGHLTIMKNDNGNFTRLEYADIGLPSDPGCSGIHAAYTRMTAGDLDRDGDVDIIGPGGTIYENLGNVQFNYIPKTTLFASMGNFYYFSAADINNNGSLDLVGMRVGENGTISPSIFYFENNTTNGHWLKMDIHYSNINNIDGIGSKVWLYEKGHLNDPGYLVYYNEVICASNNVMPITLFAGTGNITSVDLKVIFPMNEEKILLNVSVDQYLLISSDGVNFPPSKPKNINITR